MRKPFVVEAKQLGRVWLMPKTLFAQTVHDQLNVRYDTPPYVVRTRLTARPDEVVTLASLTFVADEGDSDAAKAEAGKRVNIFVTKYNLGVQSFGFAELRSIRGDGSRVVKYSSLDKIGHIETLLAPAYQFTASVMFHHKMAQVSMFELLSDTSRA